MEKIRKKNTRLEMHEKIKKAMEKKPTASYLANKGLTTEQINKLFGHNQPPKSVVEKNTSNKRIISGKKRRTLSKRAFTSTPIKEKNLTSELPQNTRVSYLDVPSMFSKNKRIDVSIIVPLYKSNFVIEKQIEKWDVEEKLSVEIIYVDDACPANSGELIIPLWKKKLNQIKGSIPSLKIIKNEINHGFSHSCNVGAIHASGKYLIFLNADVIPTKNWITPMVELIESDANIGVVGNMQLSTNGTIESLGSEWSWQSMYFQHIGKRTWQDKKLQSPILVNDLPKEFTIPGEREMVTAACMLISKDLFFEIEGFDEKYRIGYWEDSDLNMKVHESGKKIYFQPKSVVYHNAGHTKCGGHPYIKQNKQLFFSRWVDTGILDQYIKFPRKHIINKVLRPKDNISGKVVGCVIACNEEEFLEVSVDSVSSIVDQWYFVIGGNTYAHKSGMCDDKGYPTDKTLSIAKKLSKKYNGTVIEPPGRLWKDKVEMRNAYAEQLNDNDWMFMLDGDEVYKKDQLWRVSELMKSYEVLVMQFFLFWNNVHTLGIKKWEQFTQERIVKWKKGYGYRGQNHLHVSDHTGVLVKNIVPCWQGKEKLFYHYSWIRPIEKIRQKLAYYKHQSGNDNDQYVDNIFLQWRKNPEMVGKRTHPMGGGECVPYVGTHPAGVQKLIDQGKLNF